MKRSSQLGFGALFLAGLVLYGRLVIQSFAGPLMGGGDTDFAEHLGFLFARLVHFWPVPHLSFDTDLVLYPFGVSAATNAWSWEREYLYWLGTAFGGQGPWLQLYALASVAIAGAGAYYLLRREFGIGRAALVGFAVAFFNFYAAHKYPFHFNISVCHWTALNLIADFLLYRHIVQGRAIGLREFLVRVLLLVLALGQDLSYVAGFALLSFTVHAAFVVVRNFRRAGGVMRLGDWRDELRAHRGKALGLGVAIAFFSFLYVPLCVQLLSLYSRFSSLSTNWYWANPVRWLVPWLPFFNPGSYAIQSWLRDSPEGLGAASPGWALLVPALVGIRIIWREKLREYTPLLTVLALCLVFHPVSFPILKALPWFTQMRVAGRSTILFPVILALLALPLTRPSRWVWAGWGTLAALELVTAYHVIGFADPFLPPESFTPFMDRVARSSGEAILDWPFCIASGNGIPRNLCPSLQALVSDAAAQRFHHKKVVGLSFGRLATESAEPYEQTGWQYLLRAVAEGRCLNEKELQFFDDFYTRNQFSGIALHAEKIPRDCAAAIYRRFGTPSAETRLPGSGRVQFIEKDPIRRAVANAELGKKLQYHPRMFLKNGRADFVEQGIPYGVEVAGLGRAADFLPATDRTVTMRFFVDEPLPLRLHAEILAWLGGQSVSVKFNHESLARESLPEDIRMALDLPLDALRGENELAFVFDRGADHLEWWEAYRSKTSWLELLDFPRISQFARTHRGQPARFLALTLEEGSEGPLVAPGSP